MKAGYDESFQTSSTSLVEGDELWPSNLFFLINLEMKLCFCRPWNFIMVKYGTWWNEDSTTFHKFGVERIQIKNGGWIAFAASGNSLRFHAAA